MLAMSTRACTQQASCGPASRVDMWTRTGSGRAIAHPGSGTTKGGSTVTELQRQVAREHRESLELHLLAQIRLAGLPEPEREARWHPARRWRFDMLWRDRMIAAEVEGGTWSGGRHVRGRGYAEDCTKYNEASLMGYRVLRFTRDAIEDGSAVNTLARALRGEVK